MQFSIVDASTSLGNNYCNNNHKLERIRTKFVKINSEKDSNQFRMYCWVEKSTFDSGSSGHVEGSVAYILSLSTTGMCRRVSTKRNSWKTISGLQNESGPVNGFELLKLAGWIWILRVGSEAFNWVGSEACGSGCWLEAGQILSPNRIQSELRADNEACRGPAGLRWGWTKSGVCWQGSDEAAEGLWSVIKDRRNRWVDSRVEQVVVGVDGLQVMA